ncbi:D-alanyl-lipoteichoic acid acyltransferase DltB (MBOAT superfamily) [Bradyrhizobium elkanii]|uniref:MBOAT family O-acyltransferase n=1 Tax=Bradyrhizobium TaxID=374 RepID=UPI002167F8FE|nr:MULTISPECIES: MBOAT family O-acyltransferase [Bradyrhizobium]MCS3926238.1 D-alanyl-lipoteichoic acid acyltransferase DltB (MBOAT superfamily) [Bradyrhizobium elkanii]MCS3966791.1 D-alanyl-lipoteichoic acid acyltransferase DltB (MBOAT superfamily) [Bradyrhizobium japonicum]
MIVLFNSTEFILNFLPVTLLGYTVLQIFGLHRLSFAFVLLASIYFYGWWRVDLVLVLVGSVAVNYGLGRAIVAAPRYARALTTSGIVANLALLASFKYTNFFIANVDAILGTSIPFLDLVLPLGISFFTFVQIAYLVDTSKGKRGRHGFIEYALFVTFFPHLLAGPIVHHSAMIPQFQLRPSLSVRANDIVFGLLIFLIGLAKKTILADHLAPVADATFASADRGELLSATAAWAGAMAYTFQLYFDFSGYSDMAVGLARMFSVRFPWNFDSPYKSVSIVEFWRRWHMTLSRFLRDYLYIPLGGNRRGKSRHYLNLFLTMVIGGFWHGAAWTYIIWGAWHGALLLINHGVRERFSVSDALPSRVVTWALTFAATIIGWVFFRATTVGGAVAMLKAMFIDGAPTIGAPVLEIEFLALLALAALIALFAPNARRLTESLENDGFDPRFAGAAFGALVLVIIVSKASMHESPFLYFNF